MILAAQDLIGVGLYTPDEAARYARVRTRTVQRWVFGDASGDSVIRSQLPDSSEKIITFLDFVQTLAVRSVRLTGTAFPLQKIRKACDTASEKYSLRYPLAAKDHKIYLFGPKDEPRKCEMIITYGHDDVGKDQYLQLTGKKAGNLIITEIAEPFMRGLEFGETQFAERFIAWKKEFKCATDVGASQRVIVMDPQMRFGEPYLPSCGYTALALWEAYINEGGIEPAAKAYGVEREDVELACEYFDYLTGSNAA